MRNTRAHRLAGAAALAVLALAAAGCGSTGSKATPIINSPSTTAGTSATTKPRHFTLGSSATPTTVPASSSKPSAAELTALQQQLNDAGSSISAAGSAVSGSDVNTAKAQEGSAP